jgi:CheY-like chemotaxis protein
MPLLRGPFATKEIRNLGYTGIIVGVTGNVLEEDIKEFIEHGADSVIPKPFNIAAFNAAVVEIKSKRSALYSESRKIFI